MFDSKRRGVTKSGNERSAHASGRSRARRFDLRAAIALALAVAVAGSAMGTLFWTQSQGGSARQPDDPSVKEFTLVAQEVDWELQPGVTVRAWTYNGQLPGPEIRVTEGDLVRVKVVNELPSDTTVHWHGVDVPPAMDGPVGLNQEAIAPGETFTYEFIAAPAGTRWYHSHTDVTAQVMLGLYGSFVIEPKEETAEYDQDYTYVLSEWDLEMTPDVALGNAPLGQRDSTLRGGELGADLFLFNGKMHEAIPPIFVTEGDRVLIRLVNAGNMPHPFHIHGHSFTIVATDGNPVPPGAQLVKDTVMISPGERYDIVFDATNPGVWMVHCHIENHADNGMMTVIQYEGELPTGPLVDGWDPTIGGAVIPHKGPEIPNQGHMGHSAPEVMVEPVETPAPETAVETPAATQPGDVLSGEITVAMADNRFVPKTMTIEAGSIVTFVNKGTNWHSVAGGGGLIDSGQVGAGQSYSVTFDEPGEYKLICRHHLRQGMTAVITVV
jgi:plastocyanin/translation initiation factor IF-1